MNNRNGQNLYVYPGCIVETYFDHADDDKKYQTYGVIKVINGCQQ